MANNTTELSHAAPTAEAQELHETPVTAPAVDIFENEDGYLLYADVPGVKPGNLDVHFDRGELRLEARREYARHGTSLGSEFEATVFKRSFKFPDTVDGNSISASLNDGVLELRLPKSPAVKPRRIAIQA